MIRPSAREANELRELTITRNYTKHAEGSVLVCFGDTKVLCTASVESGVPRFLKGQNQGWVTAEYGMLPRSTHNRMQREAASGKQGGRTQEIQRLIGRSLRACVNMKKLGDYTITIDCDVIQADGGTRTASITGGCVALIDAIKKLEKKTNPKESAIKQMICAVSVGIYHGEAVLDLDYEEDVRAETDMNFVMTQNGEFIEIQGTAEAKPFTEAQFMSMMALAKNACEPLIEAQRRALES